MNFVSRVTLCAALLCASSLAIPARLAAQEDADSGEFDRLVEQAQIAYAEGRFVEATRDLKSAYIMRPSARLLFNIGKTIENRGDCAASLAYIGASTRAADADDDLMALGAEALADTSSCPDYDPAAFGLLVVRSEPSDAEVLVNGSPIGASPVMVPNLQAGTTKITVSVRGFEPEERTIDLTGGADKEIFFKLSPAVAKKGRSENTKLIADVPARDAADSSGGALRYTSYALVGLGVVGLGVGAYYNWGVIPGIDDERLAIRVPGDPGFRSDLEEPTDAQRGTQRYSDLTSEREDAVSDMVIITAVGAAVTLTGVGLYYFSTSGEPAASVSIAPTQGGARRRALGALLSRVSRRESDLLTREGRGPHRPAPLFARPSSRAALSRRGGRRSRRRASGRRVRRD